MKILVTGGAGFIGSAVCRHLISDLGHSVVNLDKLTYAANLQSLRSVEGDPRYTFHQVDVCNTADVLDVMRRERVEAVMHLAAESHVDRAIDGPADFIQTNIIGTYSMLEASRRYWREDMAGEAGFRFHHVSTDEVFGDLERDDGLFVETTAYAPSSPYSASKASADHLVRAWSRTYDLPIVVSNCSNNYGPFHFPEKLIPLMILNAMDGLKLPVYGKGENVRDWLFVEDHARALVKVLTQGRVGETYLIGGDAERTNLQVVEQICDLMDERTPTAKPHRALIEYVSDRPGHDLRYAVDASKAKQELNWAPSMTFEDGLCATVDWYLSNDWWWRPIREQTYKGERLGVKV